jgi:hypothetical protein
MPAIELDRHGAARRGDADSPHARQRFELRAKHRGIDAGGEPEADAVPCRVEQFGRRERAGVARNHA